MLVTLLIAFLIGLAGVAITNLVTADPDQRRLGYIISVIVAVVYFFFGFGGLRC
jgi:Na+-driven multidrug efflux pump